MVKMQAHICIGTKDVISIEHVHIFSVSNGGTGSSFGFLIPTHISLEKRDDLVMFVLFCLGPSRASFLCPDIQIRSSLGKQLAYLQISVFCRHVDSRVTLLVRLIDEHSGIEQRADHFQIVSLHRGEYGQFGGIPGAGAGIGERSQQSDEFHVLRHDGPEQRGDSPEVGPVEEGFDLVVLRVVPEYFNGFEGVAIDGEFEGSQGVEIFEADWSQVFGDCHVEQGAGGF